MSHESIRRKSIPGRENSKCKGPEARTSFVCVPGTASRTLWRVCMREMQKVSLEDGTGCKALQRQPVDHSRNHFILLIDTRYFFLS